MNMETTLWDQPVCESCGKLLTEDDQHWCDQCHRLFCGCWYVSCQREGCDFSACSQCMNEHEAEHDADEPRATELLQDPVSLVSRALIAFGNEIRALRDTVQQSADHTNQRLDQIENDVRRLNNSDAVSIARDRADLVADQLGLIYLRQLGRREIIELSRGQDNSDIPAEDLRSFQQAHLIIKAVDENGILQYIAVEAALVASTEHVLRAIINAEYLTRFTACQASGVIAAVRIEEEIQSDIDEKEVIWYQLNHEA